MLVLASASPRRRALLAAEGLDFRVDPADVDESLEGGREPEEAARELAQRKAEAVLPRYSGQPVWILAADTIVALQEGAGAWRLLGKPADAAEAASMLRSLSDSAHRVVTGVCAARGLDGALEVTSETTLVTMRTIEPHEVDDYVASGEWQGKAGGYAIQETADRFVVALEGGGFDNVVGLPVARALELVHGLGLPR
ncbi:MAG: Maf family protein [Planctomycetota bacterium]